MPPAVANGSNDTSSNRRQPVRQTRTQPPKYALTQGNGSRTMNGTVTGESTQLPPEPGFYPALTHFTDSITALPKEMLRHFDMFKEVDSKIYGPDESLKELLQDVLAAPQPPLFAKAFAASEAQSRAQSDIPSASASVNGAAAVPMLAAASHASHATQTANRETYDLPRRQTFWNLRRLITEMLPVLEEKNHVISSATDELAKQLARCESSWTELEKEFSEETRWGNLHHWAYLDRGPEKKDARVERPRREAAVHHNFAAVHDDFGALRGNAKKRAQQAQIEHEIEETRANKRALGAGKAKKPSANQASAVGLGLGSGPSYPPAKKRKPDQPGSGALAAEKSLTSVFGKNGNTKVNSSPRARSPVGVKRARATVGGTTGSVKTGRARAATGASAANSPLMASAQAVGSLSGGKANGSPALGPTMQRQPSSRARQNSTQGTTAPVPNPKSTTGGNNTQNNDLPQHSVKGNGKTPKGEPSNDELEARPATVKKEENSGSRHRPPSISTGTRASGKASKTATPIQASFTDVTGNTRPRSNRAAHSNDASNARTAAASVSSPSLSQAPKRSHKKGSGSISGLQRDEVSTRATASIGTNYGNKPGDDGIEDDEEGNGERYCYCGGPSYGDMVGCDGEGCPREWFHLDCIGLSKIPAGKAKWYCEECKKRLKIS